MTANNKLQNGSENAKPWPKPTANNDRDKHKSLENSAKCVKDTRALAKMADDVRAPKQRPPTTMTTAQAQIQ